MSYNLSRLRSLNDDDHGGWIQQLLLGSSSFARGPAPDFFFAKPSFGTGEIAIYPERHDHDHDTVDKAANPFRACRHLVDSQIWRSVIHGEPS